MIINGTDYSITSLKTQLKQFEHFYEYTESNSELVPLKGEVCIIRIPAGQTQIKDWEFPSSFRTFKDNYGNIKTSQEEYVLIVGDGSKKFSDLPFMLYDKHNHIAVFQYGSLDIEDYIPGAGQICVIKVPDGAESKSDFPLPNKVGGIPKQRIYIKIGFQGIPLKDLPWVGEIDEKVLHKLNLKFLETEDAKGKLNKQINEYLTNNRTFILDCNIDNS